MNKKIYLGIITLMMFLLIGCVKSSESKYTITKENEIFFIDTINQTISHDNEVYKYKIDGNSYEITYPDNSRYWYKQEENGGFGGWSDDYNETKYISGSLLIDILSNEHSKTNKEKNFFAIFILFILGGWNIIFPYSSWYLNYGWRYKDAEPSDAALILARLSGVIIIIITLVLVFN